MPRRTRLSVNGREDMGSYFYHTPVGICATLKSPKSCHDVVTKVDDLEASLQRMRGWQFWWHSDFFMNTMILRLDTAWLYSELLEHFGVKQWVLDPGNDSFIRAYSLASGLWLTSWATTQYSDFRWCDPKIDSLVGIYPSWFSGRNMVNYFLHLPRLLWIWNTLSACAEDPPQPMTPGWFLTACSSLSMPGSSHFGSLQIQWKQLPGTQVEALTTLHVQDLKEVLKKHGSTTFCWLKVQLNLEKIRKSTTWYLWVWQQSKLHTLLCAGRRRVTRNGTPPTWRFAFDTVAAWEFRQLSLLEKWQAR